MQAHGLGRTEMSPKSALGVVVLFSAACLTVMICPAGAQRSQRNAERGEKSSGVPRLYVATGPSSEADLSRLRDAIGKLPGVGKVNARAEFDAVTVTIEGDGRSTESLLTAAAKS